MTKNEWSKLATSLQESLSSRQHGAVAGSEVSTSLGDVRTLAGLATASAAAAVSARPSKPDFDVERIAAGFASAEAQARLRQDESSRPPKQSHSRHRRAKDRLLGRC